jgi:hypothetical protein
MVKSSKIDTRGPKKGRSQDNRDESHPWVAHSEVERSGWLVYEC